MGVLKFCMAVCYSKQSHSQTHMHTSTLKAQVDSSAMKDTMGHSVQGICLLLQCHILLSVLFYSFVNLLALNQSPHLMRTMALWYMSTANRPEKNCSLKPYDSCPPPHFFTLWGIQHSAAHNDTPADSNNWEVTLVLSGNTGWLLSQSTLCLQRKSHKRPGSK